MSNRQLGHQAVRNCQLHSYRLSVKVASARLWSLTALNVHIVGGIMNEQDSTRVGQRGDTFAYSIFERLTLAMVLLVMFGIQLMILFHIQAEHSTFTEGQMFSFNLAALVLPWMILAAAFWEPLWDAIYRGWALVKRYRGVGNAE